MLYVSVKWSRLQGLNFSRSAGVIGRTEDMIVVGAKVVWELVKLESWTCFLIAPSFGTHSEGHPVLSLRILLCRLRLCLQ